MIEHQKDLRSVQIAGGEIRRSLVTVGREPVVLLHKSHPILPRRWSDDRWRRFSESAPVGPATAAEVAGWNLHCPYAFNCHTVSIGVFVGMRPDSWLEGSRSLFTLMENPAETLLKAFFQQLDFSPRVRDLADGLRADDVLVFRAGKSGELVHSARVRVEGDRVVLVSKLGEHGVAATTLKSLAQAYSEQFDEIQLWRSRLPLPKRTGSARIRRRHPGLPAQTVDVCQDLGDRTIQ